MKITMERKGSVLIVKLDGALDTQAATELKNTLLPSLDGIKTLYLDMAKLGHLSIDGLRAIFAAQEVMNRQGCMILCHAAPNVMAVFEMTGMKEFLIFE